MLNCVACKVDKGDRAMCDLGSFEKQKVYIIVCSPNLATIIKDVING